MKTILGLFPKPPVDASDIMVGNFGIQETIWPKINHSTHGKENFLLMFFYDEIELKEKGEIKTVSPCSLIIWEPRAEVYYGHSKKDWKHSWIHFNGPALKKMLIKNRIPLNRILPFNDNVMIEKYMMDISNEVNWNYKPDAVIIKNIFENWFREIAREIEGKSRENQVPQKYLDIKQNMESNYNQKTTLAELARQAHCTIPHFCLTFKRYFRFSPWDYLIHIRMRQATRMLRDYNLSVSEIAELAGYDDIYYFSARFKKHFGISPLNMRKSFVSEKIAKHNL